MASMKDLDRKLSYLSTVMKSLELSMAGTGWNNRLHPEAKVEGNPLSFAALAYLHEYGSLRGTSKEVPARKLFFTTLREIETNKSKEIKRIILTNMQKYDKIHKSELLQDLADFVKTELESIMGDSSMLLPNSAGVAERKGGNTPLVDSGALKHNIITKVEI